MAGGIDIRMTGEARPPVPTLRNLDWETHLQDAGGDTSALSFLSGFGLGSIIGVLVAILLAPQSGRQIRQHVRHTGIELRSHAPHLHRPDTGGEDGETLADEAEQAEIELLRRMTSQGDEE